MKSETAEYEITILRLRQEANAAASHLSSIYVEVKEAEKKKLESLKSIEEASSALLKIKSDCDIERVKLESERKTHEESVNKCSSKVESLKEEEKLKTKELKKLNAWILSAEDEKKSREKEIEILDKKIAEKKEKALAVLALENEIIELEKKRKQLIKDGEKAITEAKEELIVLHEDIKKTESIKKSLVGEVNALQQKKTDLDNQYTLKVSDLMEYTQRVRDVWNQVFPGRNMPMLK